MFSRHRGMQCPSGSAADAPQSPGGVTAYQRLRIAEGGFQGWYGAWISEIAQGDGDIAQQAPPFGAFYGAVTKLHAKRVL